MGDRQADSREASAIGSDDRSLGEWPETCWREVRTEVLGFTHGRAQSPTGIMEKVSNCGVGEDS